MSLYTNAATGIAATLRMAAEELESAARYGVPIPRYPSFSGHPKFGGMSFSASPEEFVAWVEYTEAAVEAVGDKWLSARADVNGLQVEFFVDRGLLSAVQLEAVVPSEVA